VGVGHARELLKLHGTKQNQLNQQRVESLIALPCSERFV